MKTTELFMLTILLLASVLCHAQDYVKPSFDYRGMSFSVNYQTEHIDEARFRSLPLTACYKFNSKLQLGFLLKPTFVYKPEQAETNRYFTVDENGNHIFGVDKKVTAEAKNDMALPLALMFRFSFTGNRINSPFVEICHGVDAINKSSYASYTLGGRFGFGADNRKAFILGGGLILNDLDLDKWSDYSVRFGLLAGFEF